MFYFSLFLIGTAFGSFSTVLIERWHSGKGGILLGRSECPKCHTTLSWRELFPIFSYIFQQGKCHTCKVKIPFFYPIAEITMGLIFIAIGSVFLNGSSDFFSGQMFILFILGFITGVYILYDSKYMEIPDQVLVPGIYFYLLLLIASIFFPSFQSYLFDNNTFPHVLDLVYDHLWAAFFLYTFFYIQILIPGSIYLIKNRRMKDFGELLISYFTFPITLPFQGFIKNNSKQEDENESIPTWIGGGDLRLALFIGLTLGVIHGVFAFITAYVIGSIIGILLLLKNREKHTQIAFGPFLGIGWLISLFFHGEILNYVINSININ